MKKFLLIIGLLASVATHAQTSLIKSYGYQQQVITVGELTTAQGEQGLALNLPGHGDKVFTPTDAGAWNTGAPGKRQFIQHWQCKDFPFMTLQTFQHEENQELDILVYFGKDLHLSLFTFTADKY